MSDREDLTNCKTKEWFDSNASTPSICDLTESLRSNDNRCDYSGPLPPPTQFIINFQKCLDLFGIECNTRPHNRHIKRQTEYDSKNKRLQRKIDGRLKTPLKSDERKTQFECCSPHLDTDIGGGDGVPKLDGFKMNSRSKTGLNCVKCGKRYSKGQYVRDHFRTVHNKCTQNYCCRVCGMTFSWRVTALKHIKKSHPEKDTSLMIDILY